MNPRWFAFALGIGCAAPAVAPADPDAAMAAIAAWRHPAPMPVVPLIDQDGRAFSLPAAGRWTLLTFVYAGCDRAEACPLTMRRLVEVDAALPTEVPLDIVAVTLDPVRDDAAALRGLAARHGFTPGPHRRLATGDVRLLTEGLPALFNVVAVPEGDEVAHSVRAALLDPAGVLVSTFDDNRLDAGAIRAAINGEHARR